MNIIKFTVTDYKKLRRRKRLKGNIKNKLYLKFLIDNCQRYPSPVVYTDEIWINGLGYVNNPKPYHKRLYRGNRRGNRYQFYKKHANRVVRRFKRELNNGNNYKKCFDYWWTVN